MIQFSRGPIFTRLRSLLVVIRYPGIVRYLRDSFAQEGEDMIISRILGKQQSGFYVDVGAHHPYRFSNTFHFYLRGWRGINIDPNPLLMKEFSNVRSRDINIACGVSDYAGSMTYHQFDEPALNTFDEKLVEARTQSGEALLLGTSIVAVRRLDEVLAEHLPAGTDIDFLSIDAEGFDYRVLTSNDWARFRPRHVLVEALRQDLESIGESDTYRFMVSNGYSLVAKTVNTCFYSDRSYNPSIPG